MFSSQNSQVSSEANYIEDVFSTYLYTGNGSSSTRSITTGVDSSTYGSLVWIKNRTVGGTGKNHYLTTTALSNAYLLTNTTDAAVAQSAPYPVDPTSTGFNLNTSGSNVNTNGQDYVSWTFREAPKFFDVVTYTGNGATTRNISHNLGSTPGCVIVKKSSGTGSWYVWHRSIDPFNGKLNTSDACGTSGYIENVTSTTFGVSYYVNPDETNVNGESYVAYLFAHNAGGFGLTGTDNVISCGSFTTNGSGAATVSLGYEPQMLIVKRTDAAEDWFMVDNMRGWFASPSVDTATLKPNSSGAEFTWGAVFAPSATGFTYNYNPSSTYIYIAIRRGPMKVPTSGTSVYNAVARTGTGAVAQVTGVGFSPDFSLTGVRSGSPYNGTLYDRLRGAGYRIGTRTTAAEGYDNDTLTSFNMNGVSLGADNFGYINTSGGIDYINWFFKRAPSFFDEVCYTGTGSARTVTHNLGVAPEMMIVKVRDSATDWAVYHSGIGATKRLILNLTDTPYTSATAGWNDTAPTASVFTVGTNVNVNGNGYLYVAYLFATCAGVSKVFSYTGNGSSQTINCGFTGGARWILIKRTDSTGDWYVWDSARGIVSGNDPHLSLNTTAAEVTTDDTIDTDSTGFVVNQVSATNVNVSSATYIGIAIA